MPYTGPEDSGLPERIKKLSKEKRNHWVGAWNGAFQQYKDEGRAFAVANAAIKEADTNYYLEEADVQEAEMTRQSINDLPDSDFAYIEPGGEKDSEDKTIPRSLRHFPVHDAAHVRNALARASQSPFGDKAMPHIQAMAKKMNIGEVAEAEHEMDTMMKAMMAKGMPKEMAMAAAKKKMSAMSETTLIGLTEAAQVLAEANGAVEVTIIRPGWSDNGNYYGADVLARAIPMFEGLPAYVNHPTKSELKDRPGRDLRDLVGYYEGVHLGTDGSVQGTLKLLGANGDMLKPLIQEAISKRPDLVGISINAAGRTKTGIAEGRRGTLVEEIVALHSSDVVTRPAAGGRFERLVAGEDWVGELLKAVTPEEWRKYHTEEVNMTEVQEQVQELVAAAIKPLQEALAKTQGELTTALRRESARAKLAASSIPQSIHGDLLETLVELDGEAQDVAITAEVEKLRKLNIRPVITGAGQGQSPADRPLTEQAFERVFGVQLTPPKADEDVWTYRDRVRKAAQV